MKRILLFGETLWDLLPDGRALGGAPLNVACRLADLGDRPLLVTRLGRDALGREAAEAMAARVELSAVQFDDHAPTGTVDIRFTGGELPDYTIVPGVAYERIEADEAVLAAAATCDAVYFGTLAQRSEANRRALRAILDAATPEALRVCDLNLRKGCFNVETVRESLARADLVKANLTEISVVARLLGRDTDRDARKAARAAEMASLRASARAAIRSAARSLGRDDSLRADSAPALPQQPILRWFARWLTEEFDVGCCVVTLEERGSWARLAGGREVAAAGYRVEVADILGCGDAFTAGLLHRRLQNSKASLADCLDYGNALGALVAARHGASAPVAPEAIDALRAERQSNKKH